MFDWGSLLQFRKPSHGNEGTNTLDISMYDLLHVQICHALSDLIGLVASVN
jgi:hypothetical protein